VTYTKYARFRADLKRRESWEEIIDRYVGMMLKKHCGDKYFKQWRRKKVDVSDNQLAQDIIENSAYLYDKRVLPSMRALQFAGPAIEKTESRVYNCFSRDTRFITSNGVKSFEDYSNGDECRVLTHTGSWKKAVVRNYGKQDVGIVNFKKGRSEKSVKVTSNHRWLLRGGKSTTDLKLSDVLHKTPEIPEFDYHEATPIERLYWCYGFVYGDGTKVQDKSGNPKYSMLRLCGDDVQYESRFVEMGFKTSSSTSLGGDVMVYTGKYLKTEPDLNKDSLELIKAFVYGYCQADAYKNINYGRGNGDAPFKGIQSSEENHIKFIHEAFEVCGMYITSYDDLTGQETNYGVRPYTERIRFYSKMSGKHPQAMWSVHSINRGVSNEEVWCLEVEDDHSFVLSGGIVTGNCAYLPMNNYACFSELMFLLLGGTGVGYSVQYHHIRQLPDILKPTKQRKYLIGDSIEGWSDSVKALLKSYFGVTRYKPRFDYSDIREKGAQLVTAGGKAPGPEPLKIALTKIEALLNNKVDGDQLTPLEVHDINCYIADAVLAGGIRRAAMIALFSFDDKEMATCKYGEWWQFNSQRGRCNNSAVIVRNRVNHKEFKEFWKIIQASKSGEPGISFTNDPEYGFNPCHEISLRPFTFCNLTEINAGSLKNQEDLNDRAAVASFFGTLQAGFTDFHYLRPLWQSNSEKDSLIGVGITGIGNGNILPLDLEEAVGFVNEVNEIVSRQIGINPAARTTTIKPSGSTSCVVGTSSGIHAWHSPHYVRNIQCAVGDDLYNFFSEKYPEVIKIMDFQPGDAVIGMPMKAPKTAVLRDNETAIEFLERVKRFNLEWVRTGHRSGPNHNNVSATVNVRENEWEEVGHWMWINRKTYSGISVIPYDGGTYADAPFQECSEYEYNKRMKYLRNNPIDLTKIKELVDNTNLRGELACVGGACTLTY
jgi:ribonucleoside-diphosphate reductase alpha chain